MKSKLRHLNIQYLGIETPKTPTEIEFEILGLETVIAEAEQKISQLKQAIALAKLIAEETQNDNNTSSG
jgi:hypothetical protein